MDNELLKEVLEAVMQLPCMKWCEQQMVAQAQQEQQMQAEMAQMQEPPAEVPAEEPAPAEAPPAEEEQVAADEEKVAEDEAKVGEDEAKFEEEVKSDEEKDQMAYSEEKKDDVGSEELGDSKLRMQFDQEKRKYAKLQNDYKALFGKIENLERKERIAVRKSELLQLEAEGYVFDMADQIETVKDLEPARYSKHLSMIRKNFRKAPIGGLGIKPIIPEGEEQLSPQEVMLKASKKAEELYNKR